MLSCVLAVAVLSAAGLSAAEPTKWALLVAGSNGWNNYRHQADVCHAYHVLSGHGIPQENIVVMMYDDIAHSSLNPFPGQIFNRPHGADVYAGVPKDYTGQDVTPENFLSILQGEPMSVGSGKTIKSGPDDHVFVFFSDHGATGLIAFPSSELHMQPLNNALRKMHAQKKFDKLVFYLEACESGSMFRHELPNNIGVYAMTASNFDESSWGTYCNNDQGLPCMGDLFSVNWMQDSDKEDLTAETLDKQHRIVRQTTNKSKVQIYGETDFLSDHVADYQGGGRCRLCNDTQLQPTGLVDSREIAVWQLKRALARASSRLQRQSLRKQLSWLYQKRRFADDVLERIVRRALPPTPLVERVLDTTPERLTRLDCHRKATQHYSTRCFSFARNEYVMRHSRVLANLCETGLDTGDLLDVIYEVCDTLDASAPVNIV